MKSETGVEVLPKREYCCDGLKMVVDYADGHNHEGKALAGIQVAHVFSTTKGYQYSPLVHALPARGKGKARVKATNLIVGYCPFCGKKQPERPR